MHSSTRRKILIIDDSSIVQMTTRMMLKDAYDLVTARDGQEGVEKALEQPPDLILLDVIMPRMDGFAACKRLREHDATRALPIIMLTTRGEPQNVEAGYAAGCNEYMTKPFDATELLSRVRSFIGE